MGNVKTPKGTGNKRQFEPLINKGEKEKNLNVLEKIMNKKPKVDLETAISKAVGGSGKRAEDDGDTNDRRSSQRRGKGKQTGTRNSKIKKGPAKKGSFKKGRAAPRSAPKKKKH